MIKLIQHTGEVSLPDDTTIPFRLELTMRPPQFMLMTFVLLYGGTEDVVARGDTVDELLEWMRLNELDTNPRLLRWAITGPDGAVVRQFPESAKEEPT